MGDTDWLFSTCLLWCCNFVPCLLGIDASEMSDESIVCYTIQYYIILHHIVVYCIAYYGLEYLSIYIYIYIYLYIYICTHTRIYVITECSGRLWSCWCPDAATSSTARHASPCTDRRCPRRPRVATRRASVILEGTEGTLGKVTIQKIGVRYVSLCFKPRCFRPFAKRPFAKQPFGPLR